MNGRIKVAVCTTGSGDVVDLHFGHTTSFSIYEVGVETLSIQFVEKRMISGSYCQGPECDLPEDQEALLKYIVGLLGDCKFLLARRIGVGPAKALDKAGIKPVMSADTIGNTIRKVLLRSNDL